MEKFFIITVDTEGDDIWHVTDIKAPVETRNAEYIYRFQKLCEKYGFIPTYLTNYEMAESRPMVELGREGVKRGSLEIGAHMHAWNSPPYFPLIKAPVKRGKPYLGEYPGKVIYRKMEYLTKYLEDTFGCPIKSHRGGRWYLDSRIAESLVKLDYVVDCSCTPGHDWSRQSGWTMGSGGTDWSCYGSRPYELKNSKKHSGDCKRLVELPVTSISKRNDGVRAWFRPNGKNGQQLLAMLDILRKMDCPYIEFMIHSSELMPGGSPTFIQKGQIEKLYFDMDALFCELKKCGYKGTGITDYVINHLYEERSCENPDLFDYSVFGGDSRCDFGRGYYWEAI